VVIVALIAGLAASGGGARDGVIARVGGGAITEGELSRWITAMAPEHVVPDPPHYSACIARQEAVAPQSVRAELEEECQRQYRTLRQQALNLLISSRWLIGEATDSGVKVSDREVQTRLGEGKTSLPYGIAQADVKFRIEAELSSAKIRQMLMGDEPKIAQAQVVKYYKQNTRRFERQERRYIHIVEQLQSEAAARSVMRKIMHGANLSKIAIYEPLDLSGVATASPWNRATMRAIFSARPGVLIGPMMLSGRYAVFEVARILPRVVQPLARVRGSIEERLAEEQRRRTLANFIKAWRAKWTARTDCRPGYVVQKCRQYNGPRAAEDPLALS
jgi:foldase protein PrsA